MVMCAKSQLKGCMFGGEHTDMYIPVNQECPCYDNYNIERLLEETWMPIARSYIINFYYFLSYIYNHMNHNKITIAITTLHLPFYLILKLRITNKYDHCHKCVDQNV